MATATFIKTSLVDSTDLSKSQAIVNVNDEEVVVSFWLSLVDAWGKEGVKQYICAEALWQTGNYVDAHELLKVDATGKVTLDAEGKVKSDTRTWQKKWIDGNPIVKTSVTPEVDPLV